jgi:ribose transport system ATP-binding protein/rhamnose transport system ATP-binding protein
VAARAVIHQVIADTAARGVAVLVASSDLDELMLLSDRFLVVRDGALAAELPRGTTAADITSALAVRTAA